MVHRIRHTSVWPHGRERRRRLAATREHYLRRAGCWGLWLRDIVGASSGLATWPTRPPGPPTAALVVVDVTAASPHLATAAECGAARLAPPPIGSTATLPASSSFTHDGQRPPGSSSPSCSQGTTHGGTRSSTGSSSAWPSSGPPTTPASAASAAASNGAGWRGGGGAGRSVGRHFGVQQGQDEQQCGGVRSKDAPGTRAEGGGRAGGSSKKSPIR